MALSIKLIENIRAEFESGKTPQELAIKYKENRYRIGSLARLLGFDFSETKRDIFAFHQIKNRPYISFSLQNSKVKIRRYKVDKIDEENKKIIISYE